MADNPTKAIVLEGVGKKFLLTHQNISEINSLFSRAGRRTIDEYWALKGINMEIGKGRVAGIIGRNGAGKTTLLDVIAGLNTPTVGKVTINGRVSSILTLGAGFHGDLTGKENIYLNSSILGMSKEQINKKYRYIAEFSELGEFLDSPIKTYSSGMYLRLGFSVAINMDFDILLIDEILSVGDVSFQKKCFDKIQEFRDAGKTMLITSQSLDILNRICDEIFLIDKGEIVERGDSQKIAGRYMELLSKEKDLSETFQRKYSNLKWWADKRFWGKKEGSKEAEIIDVEMIDSAGVRKNKFMPGERVTCKARFQVNEEVEEPHFGVAIFREDGVYCFGPNTLLDGHKIDRFKKGKGWFSIEYESLFLMPGCYRFSVVIWDKKEIWAYDYHAGFYRFEITGTHSDGQLLNLNSLWKPDCQLQEIDASHLERLNSAFNSNEKHSSHNIADYSVEVTDSQGNSKETFCTNEGLGVKLKSQQFKNLDDAYLWIGIFRSDDIYCHGAFRKLGKEEDAVHLVYPSLPLLTGKYYLSAGIWSPDKKEPLFYAHKALEFDMHYSGEDHGTVYLKHNWKWELP